MHRGFRKFQSGSVLLTWVLGIQFLLLPFYHFHPDSPHDHAGKASSHRHNAYFHSLELDRIAHLTHSHVHNSETGHRRSHHSEGQDEGHLKIEANKETLKSKKPYKVLKVSGNSSSFVFHRQFKTYSLSSKLNDLSDFVFQHQLRQRSPPSLSI